MSPGCAAHPLGKVRCHHEGENVSQNPHLENDFEDDTKPVKLEVSPDELRKVAIAKDAYRTAWQ
jgi:hypothetical protein